jgi:hypothetical protein
VIHEVTLTGGEYAFAAVQPFISKAKPCVYLLYKTVGAVEFVRSKESIVNVSSTKNKHRNIYTGSSMVSGNEYKVLRAKYNPEKDIAEDNFRSFTTTLKEFNKTKLIQLLNWLETNNVAVEENSSRLPKIEMIGSGNYLFSLNNHPHSEKTADIL